LYFPPGCQNTPAKGKLNCADHCDTAIVFSDDDNKAKEPPTENCGSLIVKILNDKQTRQGTKYQVKTKCFFLGTKGNAWNLLEKNSLYN